MGTQQCDPGADAGRVFALFGPTGVGKSEAAVALGERIQDEGGAAVIIAADSMQVYSGLSRLSGAASADLQARVPHRLLGVVPVTETFSVGQYSPLAHQEIDGALERGVVPIVVGGTGLYLQAALTEMPLRPPLDPETIAAVESRLEVDGEKALRSELLNRSPAAAARISSGDHRRLVRALALLDEGHNLEDQAGGIWTSKLRRPTTLVGLVRGRERLYEAIDARVDQIAASGALSEVEAAMSMGASRTARGAIGFAELQAGDLGAMKRSSRNYAKRQMTWLRRLDALTQIEVDGLTAAGVADAILESPVSPAA